MAINEAVVACLRVWGGDIRLILYGDSDTIHLWWVDMALVGCLW